MTHDFRFKLNRNGDTPDTLKKEFKEITILARKLEEAVLNVTAHGRNYQTSETPLEDFHADRDAKIGMYHKVVEVKDWAMAGYAAVIKQHEGL